MTDSSNTVAPANAATDPKRGNLRALRAVNFFVADGQNGTEPYMALFLPSSVG